MKAGTGNDFDARLAGFLSTSETRSGEAIAEELGCSRTAVWKHVESLRARGVEVDAIAGKGYRLREPLELLDEAAIRAALSPSAADRLAEIAVLPTVDSTNTWLASRESSRQAGVAVLAECQTAGRGRRGQSWVSPFARNIYLSLGWRFEAGAGELGSLPLVLALSACEALEAAGLRGHAVKWPNDLRLDGKKLGGCLVEVQGDLGGPCIAVLGVGINVRMPAASGEAIDQPWTDVSRQVRDVSRNRLAAALLNALVANLQKFPVEGFGPFAEHWAQRDELAGRDVEFHAPSGVVRGTARGISARGGLLLQSGENMQEYLSGEVRTVRKGSLI